jgi:flagellar hook-length control protein FliK
LLRASAESSSRSSSPAPAQEAFATRKPEEKNPSVATNDTQALGAQGQGQANLTKVEGAHVAVAPERAAPVSEQIATELVSQARQVEHGRSTDLTLELHPPELGNVQIHLSSTGEGLTAHMVVANEAVRQVVEGQLNDLRQRLTDASYNVVSISVTNAASQRQQPGQQQSGQQFPWQQDAPQSPRWAASAGRAQQQGQGLDVMA